MAARAENEKLLAFLKSLNIDLSEFKDLTFGGMADEPEMKDFLSWFVSNIDENNVLTDAEAEQLQQLKFGDINQSQPVAIEFEPMVDNRTIINEEMPIVLTNKLEKVKKLSSDALIDLKTKVIEEKLAQVQVQHAEAQLARLTADDQSAVAAEAVKKSYETLVSQQPSFPETIEFQIGLKKIMKTVDNVVKPHEFPVKPDYQFSQSYVDSQFQENLSVARLKSAIDQLENESTTTCQPLPENIINQLETDALSTVHRRLHERAIKFSTQKIAYNSYRNILNSVPLLEEIYGFLLISEAFLKKRLEIEEARLVGFEKLATKLRDEITTINEICKETNEENVEPATVTNQNIHLEAHINLSKLINRCSKKCYKFHVDVQKVLLNFRQGPTRAITFIPNELRLEMLKIQWTREELNTEIRKLAGRFVESGKKESEERKKLLWVAFLAVAVKNNP